MSLPTYTDIKPPQILVVGDLESSSLPEYIDTLDDTQVTGFDKIEVNLRNYKPDIVISPLISTKFDACDVAVALGKLGYAGLFRVLVEPLPKPDVVLKELRRCSPDVDVDSIILDYDVALAE